MQLPGCDAGTSMFGVYGGNSAVMLRLFHSDVPVLESSEVSCLAADGFERYMSIMSGKELE